MNNKKRGDFLKRLRKSKKITQQKLGEMLNYSDKNISKWENGISFPSDPEILTKISSIFDVSLAELLYGEYKTNDNEEEISKNYLNKYIENYKEKTKYQKIFFISMISSLILVIIVFLLLYFFFIKGTIHSYKLTGDSDNINSINISLMTSNKISILNFYKVDSTNDINYLSLFYKDGENEHIIFSGENDNYYIEEVKGSSEYKLYEIPNNNIYIHIIYADKTEETIQLTIEERFVNDEIFVDEVSEKNNNSNEKNYTNILSNYGFESIEDYMVQNLDNATIYFYVNKFEMEINNSSHIEKLSKTLNSKNILHEKIKNDISNIESLTVEEKINCNIEKCETIEDYAKYLNFLNSLLTN